MAENSNIEWTTHTFNPWIGCAHVHKGCTNCYAEADQAQRRGRVVWGPQGTRSRTSDANWKKVLTWDRQAAMHFASWQQACRESNSEFDRVEPYERPRVFCASLADVFEDWQGPIVDHRGSVLATDGHGKYWVSAGKDDVPKHATMDDLRRDLVRLVAKTPNLDWLLLTKRPQNISPMLHRIGETVDSYDAEAMSKAFQERVWLGYSASDQPTLEQGIGHLLANRHNCRLLFLSLEPLLGPVDLRLHRVDGAAVDPLCDDCDERQEGRCEDGLGWIIIGGESGPGARPCNIAWVRSLIEQSRAAGVPPFVKQLGSRPVVDAPADGYMAQDQRKLLPLKMRDKKGGDPDEWEPDLRVREFPETKAVVNGPLIGEPAPTGLFGETA